MIRLRSLAFDVAFALWTGMFGLAIPVLWLRGTPPRAVRAATRAWVSGTLVLLDRIVGLRYVERGLERRPDGPCLIVANHQSTWETLAFLVLFPDVAIVAKQELITIPVFGWYLRNSPMIIIDRETGTKALRIMIDQARTTLDEGRSVLIFPEGTRRDVAEPVRFKRGAEMLYARIGAVVLPVAVDSGRFWPPGRGPKRPGVITVNYLDPIEAGLSGTAFTERAEHLLQEGKTSSPAPNEACREP
ncbi:MAG TPA: lysophospholipid acyltransferase family protein [Beijerinckiaceae bacterium]